MSAAALDAARRRSRFADFIGELRCYCENPECAGRGLAMTVKEDGTRTPDRLLCPACRRPLTVDGVFTLDEAASARRLEARCSVNAELYRVRARQRLGLRGDAPVPVPVRVLFDDRLPDTHA